MDTTEISRIYADYLEDTSLVGINSLLSKHNIFGRYRQDKFRKSLYEKYGKSSIDGITKVRFYKNNVEKAKFRYLEKDVETLPLAEKIYEEFVSDESVIGLSNLFEKYSIGDKRRLRITKLIYKTHGKSEVKSIFRRRLAKLGGIAYSKSGYKFTDEHISKTKSSLKKFWDGNVGAKEKSRLSMIRNCFPQSQSKETKIKRINSRRVGAGWKKHTESSKKRMSISHKENWRSGCFDERKMAFRSKGQIEIYDSIKNLGFDVVEEHIVGTKPFDIFVKELNLLIEFNGTYWHLDPRFYKEDYFDKCRKCLAVDVWERDRNKVESAKTLGYSVCVIWQHDWQTKDKNKIIGDILNDKR